MTFITLTPRSDFFVTPPSLHGSYGACLWIREAVLHPINTTPIWQCARAQDLREFLHFAATGPSAKTWTDRTSGELFCSFELPCMGVEKGTATAEALGNLLEAKGLRRGERVS